ncbi:MAG: FemAB family PEP-CTERM system-associated protein [Nitrospiraceae bacterium]|nr:FemAB family PEP-CTERM system-associated protein [Nitrospiraceae bacterium]
MISTACLGRSADDLRAWDRYVLASPQASGYHLSGWRGIVETVFGHATRYLLAQDDQGVIKGILPLVFQSSPMFGRFLVSLSFVNYGGILAESDQVQSQLEAAAIEQANALGVKHIECRQDAKSTTNWTASERKVSMRLALPDSFEQLWQAFPSKLRSQVRRAQKEGMIVEFGALDRLDDFYSVFSRCMRDLGTPVYPRMWFQNILEAFPDDARLCVVYHEKIPVSAGFLYGFGSILEIPWAAADRRFNRLSPNMLLYGSVLEHACQRGYSVFDFGRSTPDSGTYRFKEQWGAKPHQLYWYYWVRDGKAIPQLNPQNPKFDLAIRVWQRLPIPIANALGPRIVKYLP